MTTPTPQDIDRARDLVEDWYNAGDFFRHTLTDRIAAAIAAERSRLQAAAYDDAKQAAVNPMLYEDDDGPLDLQNRIGKAIDFRKRLALAQPATAEREVMPNSSSSRSGADNAPPQPAPSPAGAMYSAAAMERQAQIGGCHLDWIATLPGAHPHRITEIGAAISMLREAAAELTCLRSAPPVTEEMVERVFAVMKHGASSLYTLRELTRAALTAALDHPPSD